jgi:hypothetical protein
MMSKILGENPKPETRNPNEIRMTKPQWFLFGHWGLGFDSDFWFPFGSEPQGRRLVSGFLVAVVLFFPAITDADISLPLQGYYRTGRYMPVHVDPSTTQLAADGILPTLIESNSDTIVPVLITGSPQSLSPSLRLKPLADDERLIAFDGDTQRFAQSLFPDEKIIAIPVNPSEPLPGPPAAWESLDAIILDNQAMAGLDDNQRSALLAAGVLLAATGDAAPDVRWPWKHRKDLWILQDHPLGPAGELFDSTVFSPTYAWAPGASAVLRRQVVIAGALLGIAVIAIALWRCKVAVAAIILLSLIWTAGAIYWRHNLGIVNQAGGDIVIVSDSLVQQDSWLYERACARGIRRVDWNGSTHPVFASSAQLQSLGMKLVAGGTGNLAFEYYAIPGETVAFERRDVQPGTAPELTDTRNSPMRDLAKDDYLTKGFQIAGEQRAAAAGRWDSVIIEKITPTSDR